MNTKMALLDRPAIFPLEVGNLPPPASISCSCSAGQEEKNGGEGEMGSDCQGPAMLISLSAKPEETSAHC